MARGVGKKARQREREARVEAWWERGKGAVMVLAGIAALLMGGLALLRLPGALAEEDAFKATRPCARPDPEVRQDCLQTVGFTVDAVEIKEGKQPEYWAELSGPALGSGRVDFDDDRMVEYLTVGSQVTGTVWRGRVVAVDGVRTEGDPTGEPMELAMWGGAFAVGGMLGIYTGAWWVSTSAPGPVRRN
ncbi:hypothetical protein U9R90_27165 [Streptomyces sp. E11-3]|uniref:hypothetical protein n=1 Tax=Streptomyces sp. E11-3 TaxID=3110112 RepID=UPI00397F5922